MTEEKKEEVKKKVKNGYPPGEIKSELREEGFSEEEIRSCFPQYKYDMSVWYLLFAIIFAMIGGLLLLGGKESFLMIWTKSTLGYIFLLASGALFIFRFKGTEKKEGEK